jgi:hypothetical protein
MYRSTRSEPPGANTAPATNPVLIGSIRRDRTRKSAASIPPQWDSVVPMSARGWCIRDFSRRPANARPLKTSHIVTDADEQPEINLWVLR